jgi:hypothetical protein
LDDHASILGFFASGLESLNSLIKYDSPLLVLCLVDLFLFLINGLSPIVLLIVVVILFLLFLFLFFFFLLFCFFLLLSYQSGAWDL